MQTVQVNYVFNNLIALIMSSSDWVERGSREHLKDAGRQIRPLMYSPLGVISLPSWSTAFPMWKVERMQAMLMNRDCRAKSFPAQVLQEANNVQESIKTELETYPPSSKAECCKFRRSNFRVNLPVLQEPIGVEGFWMWIHFLIVKNGPLTSCLNTRCHMGEWEISYQAFPRTKDPAGKKWPW